MDEPKENNVPKGMPREKEEEIIKNIANNAAPLKNEAKPGQGSEKPGDSEQKPKEPAGDKPKPHKPVHPHAKKHVHKKPHPHHAPRKMNPVSKWKLVSLVLGIILIISVWTNGFSGIIIDDNAEAGPSAGESDEDVAISATGMIVLNDKRCDGCDTTAVEAQLSQIFPDLDIANVDYATSQGKELYESNEITALPAILFTDAIKEHESYSNIESYIEEKGDYLSLRIGSDFDPTKEICNNEVDDTGNGKVDCEDPDCENDMLCREEIPGRLDVFVMSQCPFGTQALDAMKEVLDNFGDDIDFHINFIATQNADGTFRALHGQPEVDENIRELCAIKHYPKDYRYMDYIWERNKNIRSEDWEPAAEAAGMDPEIIRECFEGDEGKALLAENIKIAKELGIGASPTWLANNIRQFSGVSAEAVRSNFCNVNPDMDGCGNTLSEAGAVEGSC